MQLKLQRVEQKFGVFNDCKNVQHLCHCPSLCNSPPGFHFIDTLSCDTHGHKDHNDEEVEPPCLPSFPIVINDDDHYNGNGGVTQFLLLPMQLLLSTSMLLCNAGNNLPKDKENQRKTKICFMIKIGTLLLILFFLFTIFPHFRVPTPN